MSRINPMTESENVLKFTPTEIHKKADEYSIQISSFKLEDLNYFATYFWPQKDNIKALVFVCHGYGEYISPGYDELCCKLATNGILAFGKIINGLLNVLLIISYDLCITRFITYIHIHLFLIYVKDTITLDMAELVENEFMSAHWMTMFDLYCYT